MSNRQRQTNRGFIDYDPKTDLSPKIIFWFWFIPAFTVWICITIIAFGDCTINEPIFDSETGKLLSDREEFERYIMFGEQSNADFPFWSRVGCSALIGGTLIWWGIRLQVEMWIYRKLSRKVRRWLNE